MNAYQGIGKKRGRGSSGKRGRWRRQPRRQRVEQIRPHVRRRTDCTCQSSILRGQKPGVELASQEVRPRRRRGRWKSCCSWRRGWRSGPRFASGGERAKSKQSSFKILIFTLFCCCCCYLTYGLDGTDGLTPGEAVEVAVKAWASLGEWFLQVRSW